MLRVSQVLHAFLTRNATWPGLGRSLCRAQKHAWLLPAQHSAPITLPRRLAVTVASFEISDGVGSRFTRHTRVVCVSLMQWRRRGARV